MNQTATKTDIVHLTHKPPFTAGSYNRLVGTLLNELSELRQAAISYWNAPLPDSVEPDNRVLLIDDGGLSINQRATLLTPERFRKRWFNGVADRQHLIYLWGVLRTIKQLRPKLIICHDNYKFGSILRQQINWPCRLTLVQHGLSYHLPVATAMQLYNLNSFDSVWAMTRTSYRFDRERMAAYEPVVHIQPSLVDTNRFHPLTEAEAKQARTRWGLPNDKLIAISLGRLVPQKGAHVVLQAWPEILQRCPNAFLWLVGSGNSDYERHLQSLIASQNLSDSVRLQGAVTPDATNSCYQAADLFVFPTLVSEGQSFALLEAMASGLACVASYQDSMAEAFPSETLRLVRDANVIGEFVEPVTSLLLDHKARLAMGQAARQLVIQRHKKEKVLSEIEQFFRQQLNIVGGY